jgi:hypothetical protein
MSLSELGCSTSKEMDILLLMLGAVDADNRREEISALLASGLDWTSLNELAIYHGVCPYIFEMLKSYGVNDERVALLREEAAVMQRKAMMLLGELFKIQRAMRNAQLPCLFVKGPVTALSAYKQYKLRGCRDVDMLVRKSDLPAACRVLQECSYTMEVADGVAQLVDIAFEARSRSVAVFADALGEVAFKGPHDLSILDLHWSALPGFLKTEELLPYRYKLSVGDKFIETLTPEAHFVITCLHASKHHWCRLLWLSDIVSMARNPELDWAKVDEISAGWGVATIVKASVFFAHTVLALPMPEAMREPPSKQVLKQLQDDAGDLMRIWPPPEGVRSQFRRIWRMSDSRGQGMKSLWRELIRPTDWTFNKVPLPAALYFLYPAVNPPMLLLRTLYRRWRGPTVLPKRHWQ